MESDKIVVGNSISSLIVCSGARSIASTVIAICGLLWLKISLQTIDYSNRFELWKTPLLTKYQIIIDG